MSARYSRAALVMLMPRSLAPSPAAVAVALAAAFSLAGAGCRDVSRFSTHDDHFGGKIIGGEFVRAGLTGTVELCLSLDADHLQDAPGAVSTTDGLFVATPLRPIPQIWHDPLSTMSFGEGRVQNLFYVATPTSTDDGGAPPPDVIVILSLLKSGDVEVRLLRSAPATPDALDGSAIAAAGSPTRPLFGVFPLTRKHGPCSF